MPLLLLLLLALTAPTLASERIAPYQPRFERERPVIAVVGDNRMTELVDYVVPFGVLSRSGVAEVLALASEPGPLRMMPALTLLPEATLADFDRQHPQGADYVVVPAVHHSDDPMLTAWLRTQADKGATLVGICDGVLLLAHAGLLDSRRATGHWYSRKEREADFPQVHWQQNRRYVVDGRFVTSSGVSAALPVSVALVEAIGGQAKAQALASELGLAEWSPDHDSDDFRLEAGDYLTVAGNWLAFWRHETLGLTVAPGIDETVLALRADAYSRTFRSQAVAVSGDGAPLRTRHGLLLLPENPAALPSDLPMLPPPAGTAHAALEQALLDIAERYGAATARLTALQLEHPR